MGLEDLQALVLDEADRLLEMGFAEEVYTTYQAHWYHFCSAHTQCSLVHALGEILQHITNIAMRGA